MTITRTLSTWSITVLLAVGGQAPAPVAYTADSELVDAVVEPAPIFEAYDEYGFDTRTHDLVTARVRRNETLSDILLGHGATGLEVAELVESARNTFDVRSLRYGLTYRLYVDHDDPGRPAAMVYEPDRATYVVFDLSKTRDVTVWRRPIVVERRTSSGEIHSSLYETLQEEDIDLGLAFELAEIFAWQIDFYHLQPGDRFTAVYDQRFVGGKSVGVGRVHAARFIASNREFTAFHFDKQGAIAYFDEEGNSLRKTFLAAPVKYSRISSRYTGRRFHPVLKRYRSHLGTDYAAPFGTPIRATGDGEVVEAAYKKNNGRYVKIRHNGTYTTAYLHMSRIANGIRRGKYVRQGDIIGYVGSTGLARGNHVCYRFWKHGRQVDPLRETFPSAEPVLEDLRDAFDATRKELVLQLGVVSDAEELPPYAFVMK